MPSSFNGIGTHYYGRSNLESRPGICAHCQRQADLLSYDTRVWFVLLFIPIIPLGRKRVLNYCPHCSRHRVVDLEKWQALKQERLTDATARARTHPSDPEANIRLHETLLAFGQTAEAEELAAKMAERFASDAKVQAYLGSACEYLGRSDEARPFFERALQFHPELPEANIALGLDHVRRGELDQARQRLKFIESPGNQDGLGALYALALGYQKAGRHREAHELFSVLTDRLPRMAQDKHFRKAVRRTEEALDQRKSVLPPREIDAKPLLRWGFGILALLALLLAVNFYLSRNRPVYVVNGYDQPVKVQFDSEDSIEVRARDQRRITLSEGRHRASVSGPTNQQIDFIIEPGLADRWFERPVHLLNPGGTALLVSEETTYSERADGAGEGKVQWHYGESFLTLPRADYLFAEFPPELRVKKGSSNVRKRRIDFALASAPQIFWGLANGGSFEEAAELAEWYLRRHPEEVELLETYTAVSMAVGRTNEARAFLAEGAKRRPIEIPWHRMYQELHASADKFEALVTEYDNLLEANPKNSALLYLRGRLCRRRAEAISFYTRALAENPTNAIAHYALGYSHAAAADWRAARPHLQRAVELAPGDPLFAEWLFTTRMALNEFADLERELSAARTNEPLNFSTTVELCEVLVAEGKMAEAEQLCSDYARQVRATFGPQAEEVVNRIERFKFYVLGRLDELAQWAATNRVPEQRWIRFLTNIELGNLKEAEAIEPTGAGEPFRALAVAVAFEAGGQGELAGRWREQAIQLLKSGRPEAVIAAHYLERSEPAPLAEIMELLLPPLDKAVLLTALKRRLPGVEAGPWQEAVSKLTVRREFPYYLLRRLNSQAL